jgi:hypothetical protein
MIAIFAHQIWFYHHYFFKQDKFRFAVEDLRGKTIVRISLIGDNGNDTNKSENGQFFY